MSLRLAFMGTPDFAVRVLEAVAAAGHDIAAVYSRAPRPAGRGLGERPSPVHAAASARGIEVRTPASLKPAEVQADFARLGVDAAVVVAYGLLLPEPVLATPRLGCYNVHASLLPRWRGAAPIQRAIMAGDGQTGVSIMRMEAGLDAGPVCLSRTTPICEDDTAAGLHDRLSLMGAGLMVEALDRLERGALACAAQDPSAAVYAAKIDKAEARIDFARPAEDVRRRIHALSPHPGAWCMAGGARIKVLTCQIVDQDGEPGQVLDEALTIACGTNAIRPGLVQREGKGAMDVATFLRGFSIPAGTRLG